MLFYIAVTDNGWFRFLAEQRPDEVNFWLRSASQFFQALQSLPPDCFGYAGAAEGVGGPGLSRSEWRILVDKIGGLNQNG